uniref:G-patch domain-containing protein n=2 Tax=Catharus ustulatus TaxID=91951 RepID=A0A8C3Y2Y7_CATUS
MSLIEFRRGRDQAERWKDGQLQEEPPPPPPDPSPGAPDPGADARSFYESLIAEGSGAEPARSPRRGEAEEPPSSSAPLHFCRSCGTSFRDPPARHRRSTAHLLGLGARPAAPEPLHIPPSNPGYRLLLRAGWRGGGLGRGGRGRRLPVPTELRRDRAGLGWGPGPPARVTHFGPGDTAAVAGGKGGSGEGSRSRSRSRSRSEAAERAWEIQLREYMERWDPPEPPPRAKRDPS